jgi:hypothetical protein
MAGVEIGVREEEVDRAVREFVRSCQRLMVIVAAAAHALDGVEVEARAIVSVGGDAVQRILDVTGEGVRLRILAAPSVRLSGRSLNLCRVTRQ